MAEGAAGLNRIETSRHMIRERGIDTQSLIFILEYLRCRETSFPLHLFDRYGTASRASDGVGTPAETFRQVAVSQQADGERPESVPESAGTEGQAGSVSRSWGSA